MATKSFTDDVKTSSTSVGSFVSSATPSVTYTTEIVTAITTYCPAPTTVTYGGSTYTVTEATTLTISDCPCTIKKPVTVTSSVICHSCPSSTSTYAPSFQTSATSSTKSVGTVTRSAPTFSATTSSPPIATAGAGKAAALSGGALAGVLGFAALVL
ncbi:hypothetical protein N657DRAFT_648497 [Parathielavia appendiculata]|uniref:Clock-controlled protein 6 n=1 Tax=Parathielavia appendiculata TaxID=2587402 RepID=A0AAN6TUS0_9PEZI|nr:hypothetical protein N657DRAFT_648497 [Parathielavia appendiculata]